MPIDLVGFDDTISGDDMVGEDIIGADDDLRSLLAVSGDDEFTVSGAAAARRRRARMMRRFPLGFTRPAIPFFKSAGGDTVDVLANPQLPFRGERLIIPSGIAPFFQVIDLKVGNRSQFVAGGPVPGPVFSEQGFGVALRMDLAKVSQDILLTVRNVHTASTLDFSAALLGTAIY